MAARRARPLRRTLLPLAALLLAAAGPSLAGVAPLPTDLFIGAARTDEGSGQEWFFLIEVSGSDFTSGNVSPPSGPLIGLTLFGSDELSFEDGPFTTFANLQATYPAGMYTVTLNGSETTTVSWNPTAPTGTAGQPSLVLASPSGDIYDRTPDVAFTLDCANCDDFSTEMVDAATFGGNVSFGFEALSQTPPSSPIPFSSFTTNSLLTELPAVDMEIEVLAGLANFSNESLSPSGLMFQYVEAGLVADSATFSVHAVDELAIEAAFEDQGGGLQWFLLCELEGDGLSSATLTPPVGAPIPLIDIDMLGQEFSFESSGFSSFANLQAAYPAGTWTLTVDGTQTSSFTWNPTEPMGSGGPPSLSIISPADGASGVSATPDISYALDCTNCDDLNLDVFDVPTDGTTASFEITLLDQVSLPNPILFGSLQSQNMLTELPPVEHEAELLIANANISTETLSPGGGTFEYFEVGSLIDIVTFTVPEAGAATGGIAALGMLASLASLRRRRS